MRAALVLTAIGLCVAAPARAQGPDEHEVHLLSVGARGPRESSAASAVLRRARARLTACARRRPGSRGARMRLGLEVAASGRVRGVEVERGPGDARLRRCFTRALQRLRFGRADADASLHVSLQIGQSLDPLGDTALDPGPSGESDADHDHDHTAQRRVRGEVRPGRPTVRGSMPRAAIQRVVARGLSRLRYCYAVELRRDPDLAGRLEVRLVIGPDGSVQNATAPRDTVESPRLTTCVIHQLRRMRFPATGAGVTMVDHPFVFREPDE